MLIHLHKAIINIRNDLSSSHYGFFHLAEYHAKKNGLRFKDVVELFIKKYPSLIPLQDLVAWDEFKRTNNPKN